MVEAQVVVGGGGETEKDAGREHAAICGDCEAGWDEEAAECVSLRNGETAGGDGPPGLVDCVLFRANCLVGGTELQKVEPDPEEELGEAGKAAEGCHDGGKDGLAGRR